MKPEIIAAALASAQANHATLVTRARNTTGPAAEDAWILAGAAHRIASNLCVLLATTALERES